MPRVIGLLSLTRKADYALVAMAELARRGASRVSAREVGACTGIPLPVLTNILHQLLHHGLVTSTMGSRGGYRIARAPEQISLAEMIDAIEGPFRLAVCCSSATDADALGCDLEENCRIKEPVRRVHSSLRRFLAQVSLAQIAFESSAISLNVDVVTEERGLHPATRT